MKSNTSSQHPSSPQQKPATKQKRANDQARKTPSTEIVLPIAEEAERELLGFIIWDGIEMLQKAIEAGLTASLLQIQSHRMIFSALLDMQSRGYEISMLTIQGYLNSQHKLERIGGPAYIAEMISSRAPGPSTIPGLIKQLKDIDYKRQAMKKGVELQNLAGNGASPAEIEEFLDTIPRTHTTVQSYSLTPTGLIYRKPAKFGFGYENERLTNFGAKILSELVEDDGSADERRFLEIEVSLKGETARVEVPSSKFQAMQWPMTMIGAEAIIFPTKGDQARCAIQTLSPNIQKRTVYAHTGWRKIDDEWCYLHGAGAIAGNGNRTDLSVRLPGVLRNFLLPDPAIGDAIIGAYQSALEFLEAFPRRITVPVLGAVFASVLGNPDYSVYITGQSGSFKSELTALAMNFFGSGFKRLQLPTNWYSTEASILELGFTTKDALTVIDDFAPNGQKRHDENLHAKAETVFRAAGNRAPKGKLGIDHRQRESKEPRCLYMSSGEDLPKGMSLQFRIYILPIDKGEIGVKELSGMQKAAKEGKLALSLATFLRYMASNYDAVTTQFGEKCISYRDKLAATSKGSSRQPTMMAHLLSSWRAWLTAATEEKAISKKKGEELWKMIWSVIQTTSNEQTEHQSSIHPADHFLNLLRSALFSGQAHLASHEGDEPPKIGQLCGWRKGFPLGECIGLIKNEIVYLNPTSAYIVANSQGNRAGEGLAVTETTLWKRMDEREMLIKAKGRGLKNFMPRSQAPAIALLTSAIFTLEEGSA